VTVAEHRHAVLDRVEQAGQRRFDEARPQGVVLDGDGVFGHEDRHAADLVRVPRGAAERPRIDRRAQQVEGGAPRATA
jgi:hypothetical protein